MGPVWTFLSRRKNACIQSGAILILDIREKTKQNKTRVFRQEQACHWAEGFPPTPQSRQQVDGWVRVPGVRRHRADFSLICALFFSAFLCLWTTAC